MKNILCFIIALMLFSCQEKEVQLPEAEFDSPATIEDVSTAFIFYNESNGIADLNDNNLIGSTNWIINADKRLTLGQVLPHLISLFEKRDKKSSNSNDSQQTYLSGYNLNTSQPIFLNITRNRFSEGSALSYFTNSGRELDFSNKVFVSVQNGNKVTILDEDDQIITDYRDFHKMIFKVLQKSRIPKTVFMSYDANLSYQDFFKLKSTVDNVAFINGQLAQNEFIYK